MLLLVHTTRYKTLQQLKRLIKKHLFTLFSAFALLCHFLPFPTFLSLSLSQWFSDSLSFVFSQVASHFPRGLCSWGFVVTRRSTKNRSCYCSFITTTPLLCGCCSSSDVCVCVRACVCVGDARLFPGQQLLLLNYLS